MCTTGNRQLTGALTRGQVFLFSVSRSAIVASVLVCCLFIVLQLLSLPELQTNSHEEGAKAILCSVALLLLA